MFLGTFNKLEVPDNLQDGFYKVRGLIFLVFLDCGYESRVFRPDIYQYYGLKVYLSVSSSVE